MSSKALMHLLRRTNYKENPGAECNDQQYANHGEIQADEGLQRPEVGQMTCKCK